MDTNKHSYLEGGWTTWHLEKHINIGCPLRSMISLATGTMPFTWVLGSFIKAVDYKVIWKVI